MRSHELVIGRTFGLALDHGEDLFAALGEFCRANNVRQGYIPFFLAGFSSLRLVGTCEELADPVAPPPGSVYLTNVEAHGGGTLSYNAEQDSTFPHIHVSVGLKELSANGYTSHLIAATVQLLAELIVVEVLAPPMRRTPDPERYDIPILGFGA